MTKQPRWIQSTIAAAKTNSVQMPWERGQRRDALIARRRALPAEPKTAPTLRPAA